MTRNRKQRIADRQLATVDRRLHAARLRADHRSQAGGRNLVRPASVRSAGILEERIHRQRFRVPAIDVVMATTEQVLVALLNPSSLVFPGPVQALSSVFQEYRFRSLKAVFNSTTPSTTTGTFAFCLTTSVDTAEPVTRQAILLTEGGCLTSVTTGSTAHFKPDTEWRFCRNDVSNSSIDQAFVSAGMLRMLISPAAAVDVVGVLWLEGEIEYRRVRDQRVEGGLRCGSADTSAFSTMASGTLSGFEILRDWGLALRDNFNEVVEVATNVAAAIGPSMQFDTDPRVIMASGETGDLWSIFYNAYYHWVAPAATEVVPVRPARVPLTASFCNGWRFTEGGLERSVEYVRRSARFLDAIRHQRAHEDDIKEEPFTDEHWDVVASGAYVPLVLLPDAADEVSVRLYTYDQSGTFIGSLCMKTQAVSGTPTEFGITCPITPTSNVRMTSWAQTWASGSSGDLKSQLSRQTSGVSVLGHVGT